MNEDQRQVLTAQTVTKQAIANGDFQSILTEDTTFELTLSTLLILDMTALDYEYPTVILDLERGLVASKQRTRQIIACFLDDSPLNLIFPRVVKRLVAIDHRVLPLSFGWLTFVPLSSATHGESDWVGVHHLAQHQRVGLNQRFTWADYQAETYYRGHFDNLLHVASLYSETFIYILEELVTFCGGILQKPLVRQRFYTCDCPAHCTLRQQRVYMTLFNEAHLQLVTECFYPKSEWPNVRVRLEFRQAAWQRYFRMSKYN